MNTGYIDKENKVFLKYVSFKSAVLWKDKQLSIPLPMFDIIKKLTDRMIFIDMKKEETWVFSTSKVLEAGEIRTVGQEPQWYFPIELAQKTKRKKVNRGKVTHNESHLKYV